MQNSPLIKVNVHQLMQRFRSKKELHQFLSQDCGAFLPKVISTNVYFLKQIVHGQKEVRTYLIYLQQYIRREVVKVSDVPQLEGLTIQDFLDYARDKPRLLKYLPEEKDWLHIDKKWVCDLLHTLDPEGIQKFINEALSKRKNKLEESQDLLVEMRPEFVEALNHSLQFSTHKGKSAFLLKDSAHRKRTREDIEEVKDEESVLKEDKQGYLIDSKRRKQMVSDLGTQLQELKQYQSLVEHLHNSGFIDNQGNPQVQFINEQNKENLYFIFPVSLHRGTSVTTVKAHAIELVEFYTLVKFQIFWTAGKDAFQETMVGCHQSKTQWVWMRVCSTPKTCRGCISALGHFCDYGQGTCPRTRRALSAGEVSGLYHAGEGRFLRNNGLTVH